MRNVQPKMARYHIPIFIGDDGIDETDSTKDCCELPFLGSIMSTWPSLGRLQLPYRQLFDGWVLKPKRG
jgi:hypothetical protein